MGRRIDEFHEKTIENVVFSHLRTHAEAEQAGFPSVLDDKMKDVSVSHILDSPVGPLL